MLRGPRTSNVHQRQTLCPVCTEASTARALASKVLGAILEAEQKLGQPGIWGEGWGRAPAHPGEVLPALLGHVPCVRSDSSV